MAFLMRCDNKGCFKDMEPVLDKSTNKAVCTECNKEVKSITEFAKRQMLAMGQVKKSVAPKQAWAVKCNNCSREGQPVLNSEKEAAVKLLCSYCGEHLAHLNKPFAESIKANLLMQRKRQPTAG